MFGTGNGFAQNVSLCVFIAASLAVLPPVHAPAFADDNDLWTRDTLTFDWGGTRTALSDKGIDWSLTYTGEVFGVLSGGIDTGSTYEDLIALELDANLQKLLGWNGATAHISLYEIDDGGRNAADLVGSISDPSNIDALPTFRIFTLYVEQAIGDWGSLRFGQLTADDEFVISDMSAYLINGTFGWANFAAANLPGGGPGYPLATPAVRLKWEVTEKVSALGGIFNGNPAGKDCPPNKDPQRCDYHGTLFSLDAGTLYIGEMQYRVTKTPSNPDNGNPPESVYRLGGWYHDGGFDDLGDPAKKLDGNWLLYGIADQTVWHNSTSAVTLFARVAAAPDDRNPISFYVDAGIGITGPLASRADDVIAFGFAYSDLSSDLSAMDKATRRTNNSNYPIRNGETVLELSYIAQITPWWTIQPDVQYIIHPGGNIPNPDNPNQVIENAFLIGMRTGISF